MHSARLDRFALRFVALGYLAVILVGPLTIVFWRTFEHGLAPAWNALSQPDTIHAFKLTLIITAIAGLSSAPPRADSLPAMSPHPSRKGPP